MKSSGFSDLRIVDNFYQTSSFYPMPVLLIGTVDENGQTNIGPYSLCFPYYIAGKDYYAMLLETRNNSNKAVNLLRNPFCTINFIPDRRKYMKECVRLGFPGDSTAEKMKDCLFTLADGERARDYPDGEYPSIVEESFQIFECTWDSTLENAGKWTAADHPQRREDGTYDPPYNDFNGITSEFGAPTGRKLQKTKGPTRRRFFTPQTGWTRK